MENDLTVKYYTKHRYGAGNAKKTKLPMAIFLNRKLQEDYTFGTTVMDFYFVTLDSWTSHSCHYCDVETSVKCVDVSHSEFNLNSTGNDT